MAETGRSSWPHWLVRFAYLSSSRFVNNRVLKPTVDKVVLWPPDSHMYLHTCACTHMSMYILKKIYKLKIYSKMSINVSISKHVFQVTLEHKYDEMSFVRVMV